MMPASAIDIKILVDLQPEGSAYKCAGCVFEDVEDCGSVRYALTLPDCVSNDGDLIFVVGQQ